MSKRSYRVDGRAVGTLVDGTLVKKGKQVMLFQIYDGFGVAASVVNDVSVECVEVHYQGVIYRASYRDFLEHGIPYHRPPFEAQLVLPRKHWNGGVPKQPQLFETEVTR